MAMIEDLEGDRAMSPNMVRRWDAPAKRGGKFDGAPHKERRDGFEQGMEQELMEHHISGIRQETCETRVD